MLDGEKLFPGARLLYQLDNALIHKRKPTDGLVAADMNVGWGGKQPVMRDGWFLDESGRRVVQRMVDAHGFPRGLKDVLLERRLFREGMVKEDMVEVLAMEPDFRSQLTVVQEIAAKRGHRVLYSPKGHCELSPIEFGWKWAKDRLYGQNLTAAELAKRFPGELDKIPMSVVRSWFDHCRAYLRAYEGGADLEEAKALVKAGAEPRRAERAAREAALATAGSESAGSAESSSSECGSGSGSSESDSASCSKPHSSSDRDEASSETADVADSSSPAAGGSSSPGQVEGLFVRPT